MTATDPPPLRHEILRAVSDAMVALHQRYYHRPPVTVKTRLLGTCSCASSAVSTQVERLTGRGALAFISNQHVWPDLEVEVFM